MSERVPEVEKPLRDGITGMRICPLCEVLITEDEIMCEECSCSEEVPNGGEADCGL
jgi:hypothetical protein